MKTVSKKSAPAKKATAPVVPAKKESGLDEKKVAALFKEGASTGEICLKLGMERSSTSRKLVREALRAAGTYERRMPAKTE